MEKKPSSSGKVGNFQGHVATMMMQGGRDENQNKTSWKSVLQTNLNKKIDNVSTKEAGSGAAKDSQKMGFNTMQVKIIFQLFETNSIMRLKVCLHVTFLSLCPLLPPLLNVLLLCHQNNGEKNGLTSRYYTLTSVITDTG